jgi:hypothetical protein
VYQNLGLEGNEYGHDHDAFRLRGTGVEQENKDDRRCGESSS